ncbi:larval cuticle protein 4-like [Drosophila novamexicana]|uniref:larval cuticle protein 4-like n=1 Tax=Drosophila novamexicana TaxID=47314 RepID=UPI0011E5D7FB|nr:larval cuticle protein 4-like [Drosophila novamexicana]
MPAIKAFGQAQFEQQSKSQRIMYKHVFLIAVLLISASWARDDDAHAKAEEHKKEDGHGNFAYSYDITNGIGAQEAGDAHNNVHGQFHFVSKEGVPVQVSYTADENGYHPQGDSLPTPPPTPEAILKALAYIEAHPPKEEAKPRPQPQPHGNLRH